MRAYPVIAIAAVILVTVGVKLTQFRSVHAQYVDGERVRFSSASSEVNRNVENLPLQEFHDMSFVFSSGDLTAGESEGVNPYDRTMPKEWTMNERVGP